MKNLFYCALLIFALVISSLKTSAASLMPVSPNATAAITAEQRKLRLDSIENRVMEIKALNFQQLSKAERKSLKKELKVLGKEARVRSGGVYLSVGAIIIIILLLILIL